MTDYALRVCGGGFILLAGIGLLCLLRFLVREFRRCAGLSISILLLGGWKPGAFGFHKWVPDWWWRE
jgi:hypothetical protein